MDVVQAMRDPLLLGVDRDRDQWARWDAVLKACHGLPMTDAELALFEEVAERAPPPGPP